MLATLLCLTASATFTVRHVTVVEPATAKLVADRCVDLRYGRISAVRACGDEDDRPSAHAIEARGRFLSPSLIDSHVHLNSPFRDSRLMLAHGVTFARDMAGDNRERVQLREAAKRGDLGGFQFITTGVILDGESPYHLGSRPCPTPESGRSAVRGQRTAGVDTVKVYSGLKAEVLHAIAEECKRLGMTFEGHVPDSVSLSAAAMEGMRTIEHLYGAESLIGSAVPNFQPAPGKFERGIFEKLDQANPQKVAATLDFVRSSGTALCPTLVLLEGQARRPVSIEREQTWRRYAPAESVDSWLSPVPEIYRAYGNSINEGWPQILGWVRKLDEAGIPLLLGTDLGNGYVLAGRGVWDEMRLWKEAGVPDAHILRAATSTPARVLGQGGRGRVAVGAKADLLLLTSNPLQNIEAVMNAEVVWVGGKPYDRKARQALLDAVEADVQRDTADPAPLLLKPAPGYRLNRGSVAHFFGPYPDVTESWASRRRGSTISLQSVVNSRTYGRVPVSLSATRTQVGIEGFLTYHGLTSTRQAFSCAQGFVVSPFLSLDAAQWERLRTAPLPKNMRVTEIRSRSLILQREVSVEENRSAKTITLRSAPWEGWSVKYQFGERGELRSRVLRSFSSERKAESDPKRGLVITALEPGS